MFAQQRVRDSFEAEGLVVVRMSVSRRLIVGAIGALLSTAAACGESSTDPGKSGAGRGGTDIGGSSNSSGGQGAASQGGGAVVSTGGANQGGGAVVNTGGSGQLGGTSAAQVCREYMTAVCTRIRECGAPLFRTCESPIDACPGILFARDSAFTVEGVVACAAQWKNHSCEALNSDQGPACSRVYGARATGAACVFDSQCRTGRCWGGISPLFQQSCGVCAEVVGSHQACSPPERVCPAGETCREGECADEAVKRADPCSLLQCGPDRTCRDRACVPLLATGSTCTPASRCETGLGCQIAIVPEPMPEPTQGTCQPLPAIGQPCLPNFGYIGLCAAGGTCDGRPTGKCVPLVEIGGSCGYTSCVEGAYCSVLAYDHVPKSHTCYALGKVGEACDWSSPDRGKAGCADGLLCRCSDALCEKSTCQPSPHGTDSCARSTIFGRETSTCPMGEECLCVDAECMAPRCAKPRNFGESCDGADTICRQGLACVGNRCTEFARDLEAPHCLGP